MIDCHEHTFMHVDSGIIRSLTITAAAIDEYRVTDTARRKVQSIPIRVDRHRRILIVTIVYLCATTKHRVLDKDVRPPASNLKLALSVESAFFDNHVHGSGTAPIIRWEDPIIAVMMKIAAFERDKDIYSIGDVIHSDVASQLTIPRALRSLSQITYRTIRFTSYCISA